MPSCADSDEAATRTARPKGDCRFCECLGQPGCLSMLQRSTRSPTGAFCRLSHASGVTVWTTR